MADAEPASRPDQPAETPQATAPRRIAQPLSGVVRDPVEIPGLRASMQPPVEQGRPRIIRIPRQPPPVPIVPRAHASAEGMAPMRVTRREICARIARTGELFINRATGAPVECGGVTLVSSQPQTPAMPSGPARIGAPARAGQAPQVAVPTDRDVRIAGTRSTLDGRDRRVIRSEFVSREAVPASNPVGRAAPVALRSIPSPPAGYRQVFDDGRISFQRGLLQRDYFYGGG